MNIQNDITLFIMFYIASQSDTGKKMSSTSMGSNASGGNYLSTTMEKRFPSKEVLRVALGM